MQNPNVRLAVSFLIGLIVGVGGYKLWLDGNQQPGGTLNTDLGLEDASSTPAIVLSDGVGVAVENQDAGSSVTLAQVVLDRPSWVAIHDDVRGTPGRILGARLFDVGTSTGSVELLRKTVKDANYIAVIHNDDGNFKSFSTTKDRPRTSSSGEIIMVKFSTNSGSSAGVSVSDDTSTLTKE